MFTGLIETVGLSEKLAPRGNYQILTVRSSIPGSEIQIGESIACSGPCLTVVDKGESSFTVEISQETAERIDLARYQAGSRINLERALTIGDRMGGHFVTGHIDCTGVVDRFQSVGESYELAVSFDAAWNPLVIEKGSIAIEGVSLTVNEVRSGWLSVNLIPHTVDNTNLGDLGIGSSVNLEFDLIGKYILKAKAAGESGGLTIDTLLQSGW